MYGLAALTILALSLNRASPGPEEPAAEGWGGHDVGREAAREDLARGGF